MRKVHRSGPDPPASRSRSDSFVRMLELEKMCKMKRAQQDHGSSISTSNRPRASLPSVATNPPAPRSRRESDYPPLSHQTQIMKAVRRSAALPSLSLFVPPSPTQAMTRLGESVDELSLAKEERAKTVTFSELEEEEPSDDSSICQSPSWEQYGRKKKKKTKKSKDSNSKAAKDKEDTTLKRRSNRLIKSAPTDLFTAKPLSTSDRSISAPELGTSAQAHNMNSHSLAAEAQVALGTHHTLSSEQSSVPKDKPKSRGFLSGFRLQHGNVAAARELTGTRKKGVGTDTHENDLLRSIQYEKLPVQQTNVVSTRADQNVPKSRKPPSIRSVISTSEHSLSSQERRNSGAPASTSSGHGRSQSLLSSTLNKLRGPSYLYYQPPGDSSSRDFSRHINGSQDFDAVHDNSTDTSDNRTRNNPEERPLANLEHPQQPFNFAFPPKHKEVNMEPGPEIAPRGRQPRTPKVEIQVPSTEQETLMLRTAGGRRVQIETPQISTQDSVMALVTAQEKQSHTARKSRQTKPNTAKSSHTLESPRSHQVGEVEVDRKGAGSPGLKGGVNRGGSTYPSALNALSAKRLNQREGTVNSDQKPTNKPEAGDGYTPEDDRISVDTYASTIRPVSRNRDGDLVESGRQQTLSLSRSSEPHARATAPGALEVGLEPATGRLIDDLITFERDVPDTLQQPLQPQREVDYFASFSDSYLPPVLDLRSPNASDHVSPRFPFSGESDEGDGHITHDRHKDSHDRPKEIGGSLNERKSKSSPAASTQNSDSDVPTFEGLGLSSRAAKTPMGVETASTSTAHSQHTDPSRTTSERSYSSTCGDSPPSPSSATTPDSSRPQSRKGVMTSQTERSHGTISEPAPRAESRMSRKYMNNTISDRVEGITSQGIRMDTDANVNGNDWGEPAATINVEQGPITMPAKVGISGLSSSTDATQASVSFAGVLTQDIDEEDKQEGSQHPVRPLPPRAQSALDLHSSTRLMSQSSRPQRLHLKQGGVTSSVSLPGSPPADLTEETVPRKSAMKTSRYNGANDSELLTAVPVGAAYLQEARKAAPVATASSSRSLRPHFSQKHSSTSVGSAASAGNRAEPLAKMLVECCNCHFFHDMPSRVYEAMAKPDSVVEDKLLGVSAAITTMVRCPWCTHGMTTQCCSGYAAVVYLKEKLHGR